MRGLDQTVVDRAVEDGLRFLVASQAPDGKVPMLGGADERLADGVNDPTVFGTALVALCLGTLDHPSASQVTERALAYLRSEMLDGGVWRYWPATAPYNVPPDLDDTACASLALQENGAEVPDNRDVILANRSPKGRFRTWLMNSPWTPEDHILPPPHFKNVDPVVNANVVAYLGVSDDTAAAIDYIIEKIGMDLAQPSLYYPDACALELAVSRAWRRGADALGGVRTTILERIEKRLAARGFDNSLATASDVIVGVNFEHRPSNEAALGALLAQQRSDGSWPAFAAYLGPAPYYGSAALTTAYCVEALARASL